MIKSGIIYYSYKNNTHTEQVLSCRKFTTPKAYQTLFDKKAKEVLGETATKQRLHSSSLDNIVGYYWVNQDGDSVTSCFDMSLYSPSIVDGKFGVKGWCPPC